MAKTVVGTTPVLPDVYMSRMLCYMGVTYIMDSHNLTKKIQAKISVLLFFWTLSIVKYSKTRPLCFGNWLCSRLQVKISILLGPIEGVNPNPWRA
jgi:hypothetical protein